MKTKALLFFFFLAFVPLLLIGSQPYLLGFSDNVFSLFYNLWAVFLVE